MGRAPLGAGSVERWSLGVAWVIPGAGAPACSIFHIAAQRAELQDGDRGDHCEQDERLR